jgi:hypothetical protein
MNNVRSYQDKELLDRVKSLSSFNKLPKNYWILGVRSTEDAVNRFDDKFYIFKGDQFIMVTSGTTNTGIKGLKGYDTYNKYGVAIVKADEWYDDVWKFGKHRGKMDALRQVKAMKYFRDGDKDDKSEEIGKEYSGIIGINFHCNTYNKRNKQIKELIGGWSLGCQVVNNIDKYYKIIDLVKNQKSVSFCLLNEF